MNDAHPQQHAKEEISDIPTFFAEDPRLSLSSRFDENQLNLSLEQQFSKLNFNGHNSTISEVEKSFKDEEHIYVSIFSPSMWNPKRSIFLLYRLNMKKEINEIQLISLDERNGL